MRHYSVMIKPASSLCNMKCKYCFYEDVKNSREISNYGIMTHETMVGMIKNVEKSLKNGDSITFAFQGGEPTLARLEYFKNFVEETSKFNKSINIEYSLQTNGINLNEEWAEFLYANKFLVGLSLDLVEKVHDEFRVDETENGTWKDVVMSMDLLKKNNVEFNILSTLTNELARYPEKVWNEILKLNLEYVQFTPCMDELEGNAENIYALTPERFSSFYTEIFKYWLNDYKENKYRSVKLFDDIINLLSYGVPTACGINGICQPHLIVEADGSTYPCDFYCLDKYMIGKITEINIDELIQKSSIAEFKRDKHLNDLCYKCKYIRFCNGNCKRMKKEICIGKNKNFCGYKDFLDKTIDEFILIAEQQRKFNNL